MSRITKAEAIARAGSRLGLSSLVPARALPVGRADGYGLAYYLVVFGRQQGAVGVAAVDIADGEVMTWGSLPGIRPHLSIDAQSAVECAGFPSGSRARLVWKSCQGSHSPLYPLWKVRHKARTVYVDQQGVVWQSLEGTTSGG